VLAVVADPWKGCRPNYYPCPGTGRCIPVCYFCDGDNDCGDFTDEYKNFCSKSLL